MTSEREPSHDSDYDFGPERDALIAGLLEERDELRLSPAEIEAAFNYITGYSPSAVFHAFALIKKRRSGEEDSP